MEEPMMGVWRQSRVWSQAVGFVLVRLADFSRSEDVFTFNFVYKEML
jgi:hypothetical protein